MVGVVVGIGVGVGVDISGSFTEVDIAIGETGNSVGMVDDMTELVVDSALGEGVGMGWGVFHWMAKMIKPIMPAAITIVHIFAFNVAPLFMQYP
jgi:hypothetical protein